MMEGKQACRNCGATGIDPEVPTQKCEQCAGRGELSQEEPNPVGPGVQRLVEAAQAAEPEREGAMMIDWPAVKGKSRVDLIKRLTAVYGRRNRKERQTYVILAKKAVKLGLLVPVPPKRELKLIQGKPVPPAG